jgi:8-oxo-dGTP pyrophosphatase MutT (NUDIX family)
MVNSDISKPRQAKVIVYVIAQGHLLVNWHCDFPDAGIQVPGGSIEENEEIIEAAFRELHEESGMLLSGKAEVATRTDFEPAWDSKNIHDRHFVVIRPPDVSLLPFLHVVTSGTMDKGIRLAYFWVPLAVATEILGSGHEGAIHKLSFD